MNILVMLIVGILAGYIAGRLMKGKGFGLVGNLVVGIVGALLGGLLFRVLGFYTPDSFIGSLITAVLGAVVLLYIVTLVKK